MGGSGGKASALSPEVNRVFLGDTVIVIVGQNAHFIGMLYKLYKIIKWLYSCHFRRHSLVVIC